MDLLEYRDYRNYLRDVLEQRISANESYSLRAFARDLKISPQMLSFVLNKKKNLSTEAGVEIASRLNLDPEQSSHFLDLIMLVHSRSEEVTKLIEFRIDQRISTSKTPYSNLDLEVFKVIADWSHVAILDLTLTKNFNSNPKWISSRLGLSAFEVNQAIERLKKLGLLEEAENGSLQKTDFNLSANYGIPTTALRKIAKNFLEKAIHSLEAQSLEERDITTMTMAIDPELLPEAKRRIATFRRSLCDFLEQGNRTEVYTFVPSLFRLTSPLKQGQQHVL